MKLTDFQNQPTINGLPELWGCSTALYDFFHASSTHVREQTANLLATHRSPIGRFLGGSALIELATKSRVLADNKKAQLLARAEETLSDVYAALTTKEQHPAYIVRTALAMADLPIRSSIQLERRKPSTEELEAQNTTTTACLLYAADYLPHLSKDTTDYGDLVGVGAECAVGSLLGRFIFTHCPLGDYVKVNALLGEDLRTMRKENHSPLKQNWDISVYTGEPKQYPTYKLQVKHAGDASGYGKTITPIVLATLNGEDSEPLHFSDVATLVRREQSGNIEATAPLDQYTDTLLDKMG